MKNNKTAAPTKPTAVRAFNALTHRKSCAFLSPTSRSPLSRSSPHSLPGDRKRSRLPPSSSSARCHLPVWHPLRSLLRLWHHWPQKVPLELLPPLPSPFSLSPSPLPTPGPYLLISSLLPLSRHFPSIPVPTFPVDPYPIQINFINTLYDSLSIICSALQWAADQRRHRQRSSKCSEEGHGSDDEPDWMRNFSASETKGLDGEV